MRIPDQTKISKKTVQNLSTICAYLLIVLLTILGALLLNSTNLILIFMGIGVIGTAAWLFYSPSTGFPPQAFIADPETFPVLNELVDDISAEVGIDPIPIMLTENGGCSLGLIGVPQRPVLIMGQSLLVVMPFDEKVAVIAHEAGHLRDGSFSRDPVHVLARGIIFRLEKLMKMLHLYRVAAVIEKWKRLNWEIQIADGLQSEFVADSWSVLIGGTAATKRTLTRIARFWQRSGQTEPHTHPTCAARLEAVNKQPFTEPRIQFSEEQQAKLLLELQSWPQIIKERTDALFANENVNSTVSQK